MDFYKRCTNVLSSLHPDEINEDISNEQPDRETYFNHIMKPIMEMKWMFVFISKCMKVSKQNQTSIEVLNLKRIMQCNMDVLFF